jgi:hypothetical protein
MEKQINKLKAESLTWRVIAFVGWAVGVVFGGMWLYDRFIVR